MSVYSKAVSLKKKHQWQKEREELAAENAALKEKQAELEAGMTDLQLALCSLYERAEGSEMK